MDFSASAATKDAARTWRRRSCTPPRFSSTLPDRLGRHRLDINARDCLCPRGRTCIPRRFNPIVFATAPARETSPVSLNGFGDGQLRQPNDIDADAQRMPAPAEDHAVDRADVVVVAPPGHGDVPVGWQQIVGGVDLDPTQPRRVKR